MKTTLVAYANSDDALLLWSVDALDENVEGFSIQRQLKRGNAAQQTTWIDNYAPPGVKAYQSGHSAPSDQRPFRAFSWTDHSVGPGDRVRYRAAPFFAGTTSPAVSSASKWSRWLTIGQSPTATYRAFFNRGFVISQFMSRYLDEHYPTLDRLAALKQFKLDITTQLDNRIRQFLSGEIRTALLSLLDDANTSGHHVFAALFELSDPELVTRLSTLGSRAHVVLANGSIRVKTDPHTHKAIETEAAAANATRTRTAQGDQRCRRRRPADEPLRRAQAARTQQVPRRRRQERHPSEGVDGEHELDDNRTLHPAQQRVADRRSRRRSRLPRAVARAA